MGLIRKDTGETVVVAAPVLPDGRVLIQGPTGLLEVIEVHQLAVARPDNTRASE